MLTIRVAVCNLPSSQPVVCIK